MIVLHDSLWGFPGGSAVKNPSAVQEMQEMWVQSLGREDPLEKGMATHASILAARSLASYSPWGRKESDTTEATEHTCVQNVLWIKKREVTGRSWSA